jgi:hypothetical protein
MGSTFKRRPGTAKNVPYLSHEFVIQNHGDIVTCVFMVFIVGLMFQVSAPLASLFVAPAYNLTEIDYSAKAAPVLYTYGLRDISLTFFYTLSVIIFHAVIQEYVLDVSANFTNFNLLNFINFIFKIFQIFHFVTNTENEQEGSPIKDKDHKIQRVWPIDRLLRHLAHLARQPVHGRGLFPVAQLLLEWLPARGRHFLD